MKEKNDQLVPKETEVVLADTPSEENGKKRSAKIQITGEMSRKAQAICCAVIGVLIIISVIFAVSAIPAAADAAADAFVSSKDNMAADVYQFYYDTSYESSEKAHHVSNDVSVTIGNLRNVQLLEVLRVRDVTYETVGGDVTWIRDLFNKTVGRVIGKDTICWLEVPAAGIFTVNLEVGEFIIDDARQYVLIRVPEPELTEFSLSYDKVKVLYYEEGSLFQQAGTDGYDLADEMLKSAEQDLRQGMEGNQGNYQKAEGSARKLLTYLVEQLNPQLENLTVEVEFFR